MKVAKLIMVKGNENNNKFYNMSEDSAGGTFTARWGRVGQTENITVYPIHKWDSQYKSKLRKGYKDQTNFFVVEEKIDFKDISDKTINGIIERLQAYAKGSVSRNYSVSSDAVTQKQVERAQEVLDSIVPLIAKKKKTEKINELLLELFTVIPRKMSNVKSHLFSFPVIKDSEELEAVEKMISNEQDTLDVMRGQVTLNTAQKTNNVLDKKTILEAMGLEIFKTSAKDVTTIKKLLGDCAGKYKASYRVVNKKTQERFDNWLKEAKNKQTRLFWHGSRNENWWNILNTGLLIRPSNAIHTGSMYSDGLYFAEKAGKSYGYTSGRGSRWARGSDDCAIMSLYQVHIGKQLEIPKHDSSCYSLTYDKIQAKGCDSVFALKGADLFNDEFICYRIEQCTIEFLVELTS